MACMFQWESTSPSEGVVCLSVKRAAYVIHDLATSCKRASGSAFSRLPDLLNTRTSTKASSSPFQSLDLGGVVDASIYHLFRSLHRRELRRLFRENMSTSAPCQPNGSIHSPPHALISSIEGFVEDYMSHYDASHDYKHIQRVLSLSHLILNKERAQVSRSSPSQGRSIQYDETLVTLGALLHDVGDKKYLQPGQDARTLVRDVLLERGAPISLADRVQDLVLHVSFSTEKEDPQKIRDKVASIPELAIVQDADRLDAIGAVGIARCFTFGGAKARGDGLDGAIEHFKEKLELLEGMMKTTTGRELAKERTERLKVFRGWWESENQGLS